MDTQSSYSRVTSLEYRVKTLEEEIEKLVEINMQLAKRISALESKGLLRGGPRRK